MNLKKKKKILRMANQNLKKKNKNLRITKIKKIIMKIIFKIKMMMIPFPKKKNQ